MGSKTRGSANEPSVALRIGAPQTSLSTLPTDDKDDKESQQPNRRLLSGDLDPTGYKHILINSMTPMHGAIISHTAAKPLIQEEISFAIGIAPRPGMLMMNFGLLPIHLRL